MATTHYVAAADQTLKTELDVFIPEIWASPIEASFKRSLKLGSIVTDYSPLVTGGGDVINIPTLQDVGDAVAKVQGDPVDFTTNTEVDLHITLDQHYVTATMIDDLAKIQSSYDMTANFAQSMGYKLALNVEKALFTAIAGNINCIDLDHGDSGVDRLLNKARLSHVITHMYANDMRPEECVLILSNRLYASLFQLDDFVHVSKVGNVNLPAGTVGTLMGMPVIHSAEIGNDVVDGDAVEEDGSTAVGDTIRAGGYVMHKSAMGIAYSKRPTMVAEYDMQYIAHKAVTDMIYGCSLLQDANQKRVISIIEGGQTTAAHWQS